MATARLHRTRHGFADFRPSSVPYESAKPVNRPAIPTRQIRRLFIPFAMVDFSGINRAWVFDQSNDSTGLPDGTPGRNNCEDFFCHTEHHGFVVHPECLTITGISSVCTSLSSDASCSCVSCMKSASWRGITLMRRSRSFQIFIRPSPSFKHFWPGRGIRGLIELFESMDCGL